MNTIIGLIVSASLLFVGGWETMPDKPQSTPETAAMSERTVSYEVIKTPYPAAAKQAWESVRKQGGYQVGHDGSKTYVAIGLGRRPTGGYSLAVSKVTRTAQGVVVYVQEKRPQQGAMTTQALTYPSMVIAIPKTPQKVTVVFQ